MLIISVVLFTLIHSDAFSQARPPLPPRPPHASHHKHYKHPKHVKVKRYHAKKRLHHQSHYYTQKYYHRPPHPTLLLRVPLPPLPPRL